MTILSGAQGVNVSHSLVQEIHGNQIVVSDSHAATKAIQIYRWLSAPDPSSNQDDAFKKRQKSTGTWFLNGAQFADWKNDPKSFILLFGMRTSVVRYVFFLWALIYLNSWFWQNYSLVSGTTGKSKDSR
jgi:hypothetical protein